MKLFFLLIGVLSLTGCLFGQSSEVKRAEKILTELEGAAGDKKLTKPVKELGSKREGYQLSIFQLDDPTLMQIRDEIKSLDINNLTPIEALNKLNDIRRIIGIKQK